MFAKARNNISQMQMIALGFITFGFGFSLFLREKITLRQIRSLLFGMQVLT